MKEQKTISQGNYKYQTWFDDLVSTLRAHQVQLETDTATDQLKSLYDGLMNDSFDELFKRNKEFIQKHFVSKIIVDYLKLIKDNTPSKLAFDFNDSEVLVWAEINDDKEYLEKNLILAEAKINSIYHEFGFDMESTIVGSNDNLEIPSHYKIYKFATK